ncbi:MAG: hypothetical protein JWN69_2524 [Alphaproteobacteria bacterium]|nr:hypothetical protein [Alphaproteobacteria bacterium]
MRLRAPDDAPASVHRLVKRIVEADKEARTTPLKLQPYATPSDLPPAADWGAGIVYVTSITMVAVSDGTNWRRLDTGATL